MGGTRGPRSESSAGGRRPPGKRAAAPAKRKPSARPGKPSARPGKPSARPGRPSARPGRPSARPGRPSARPAQRIARKAAPSRRAIKVTPLPATTEPDGPIRLNKFLASAGVASRRAADGMIESGRVTVDGEVVTELGRRIDPLADDVRCDGARVVPEKSVYLLFNKPSGVVCTNARNEQRRRVIDFLPQVRGRVYTVGRLDADSEGLILVTNDGDFAQQVAHPSGGVEKVYAVLVHGRVTPEDAVRARGGVWLSDGKTSGARVRVERTGRDRTYLKVTLREGRNREIRRTFAKLGYRVLSLKRVRIGPLSLHGLGSGRFRFLAEDEVRHLLAQARRDAS